MLVCNSVQDQWDLFVHMMDPDFINKLQRITLTEDEGEVIKVGVS